MRLTKWILLAIGYFLTINVFASSKWKSAPVYFTPVEIRVDKSIPSSEIEEGCYYIMVDNQLNFKTKEGYHHYAYKVTSENGVQNNSEIQINYNPAYQKLYLNSIRIYRNGKFIDYTQKVKIKELQREEELEYHIYDETLTVYIILEDIKIGDIIEYSYTREGSNPVFEDFFYDTYSFQLNYTLLDFNLRIIKPAEQKLFFKKHDTDIEPLIKQTSLGEELTWKLQDIPGVKTEELTPSWYNAYPQIEISLSDNWKQIREWGVRVFNNTEMLSGPLKEICSKIKEDHNSDAEKAIAALRFVQKNIRYLGIEIGENSHKPNSPNKVFKQGFGDCKDKSLLLVKMLRELGIRAYPALVSTTSKGHLGEYLPAPMLFDHTIVKAEIGTRNYWFDPTVSNQGGDIDHYYFAPYGYALVLDDHDVQSTSLDRIETELNSHININERISVEDLEGNARLNVITTYSGCDADEIRYSFATNSQKQIQENFLNFYKNTYLKIDTAGSIVLVDDTLKNEVIVYENYVIRDFWKSEGQKSLIKTEVSAYDIYHKINPYQNKYSGRKSPLYLEYPLHLSHTISIRLPEEWGVKASSERIDNDFFTFSYQSEYSNKTITLNYDYITKKDFVPSERSSDFIADVQKINNQISYQLSYDKSLTKGMSSVNGYVLLIFLLMAGIFGFVLYRIYRKYTESASDDTLFHESIGGWVILPIISLFLTPVLALYRTFQYNMFSDTMWQVMTGFHSPLYSVTLFFELFIQALYIVLPIALLILAFKYDKRFPNLMIWFYVFNVAALILDAVLTSSVPEISQPADYKALIRAIVMAFIWIPFFSSSERCKRIFCL